MKVPGARGYYVLYELKRAFAVHYNSNRLELIFSVKPSLLLTFKYFRISDDGPGRWSAWIIAIIYSREHYLNKMIYLYSGVAGLFTMFRVAAGRSQKTVLVLDGHATLFKPLSTDATYIITIPEPTRIYVVHMVRCRTHSSDHNTHISCSTYHLVYL